MSQVTPAPAIPVETSAATPRWARWAAYAVPLCILPSAVARVAFIWPPHPTLGEKIYIPALSVGSVLLGLLTLGLVQPWGEVVPRWVPWIGGRRVPVRAAVIPAAFGAALIIGVCLYALLNSIFHFVEQGPVLVGEKPPVRSETPDVGGIAWTYAPLPAWGPLLAAVTVAYYRRRTGRLFRSPQGVRRLSGAGGSAG